MTWGFQSRDSGSNTVQHAPYSVCHGRQRDWHASQSVALRLTVQGLRLTELLEHDHG